MQAFLAIIGGCTLVGATLMFVAAYFWPDEPMPLGTHIDDGD